MYPRAILLRLLYFICAYLLQGAECIQITALRVPPEVRNGTGKPVVLDCEYSLRPEDLFSNSGLVVKWFFNDSPAPVYQWIVGQKPQDLDVLRGRLKLDYKASSDAATMYRALYIINPTTELSGEYRCAISTFTEEDFMIKTMIVYATEKRMEMIQMRPDLHSVNLICRAFGVYPEPKLHLFYRAENKERITLRNVDVVTTARSGEYDISASVSVPDLELTDPTSFICELRIPHTTYVKGKTVVYRSGNMDPVFSVSGGVGDLNLSLTSTMFLFLLSLLL